MFDLFLPCAGCPPGQRWVRDKCEPCPVGEYSSSLGLTCTSCPAGLTTQHYGATSKDECGEYGETGCRG